MLLVLLKAGVLSTLVAESVLATRHLEPAALAPASHSVFAHGQFTKLNASLELLHAQH